MKKKDWFKPRDFVDLIERYNPFGLKQPDGDTRIFKDYSEVYLFVMNELYKKFPQGYIDLVVFLHEQTSMPVEVAEEFVREWNKYGISDSVKLLRLDVKDVQREIYLRQLMRGMHEISGTLFDEDMFIKALRLFDLRLEYGKSRRQKEEVG